MGATNGVLQRVPVHVDDQSESLRSFAVSRTRARMLTILDNAHRRPNIGKCALTRCKSRCNLMRCSRCKYRYYCCTAHQVADWPVHQRYCRSFEEDPPLPPFAITHEAASLVYREQLANLCVQSFIMALSSNTYPTKAIAAVFGVNEESSEGLEYIGVDFPVGPLVMGAWCSIYRHWDNVENTVLVSTIKKALLSGQLTATFKQCVSELRTNCCYCSELCLRSFTGIHWDQSKLRLLAGDRW